MEQLLELAHEIFPILAQADVGVVLDSVQDSSGRYLAEEHEFALQVTKDDSIVHRKRWTKEERTEAAKLALAKYYQRACILCDVQSRYMDALEEMGKLVTDHDMFVNILC